MPIKPPTVVHPYYSDKGASTAFYDVVTATDRFLAGDLETYARLLPPASRVLELGAGTGRVAFALAARGHQVTGLDIAPAMLAQAEAKRTALTHEISSRVSFVRGDMTSFALGETFDAVFCTYFALAHLPVGAAWTRTFGAVARHLAPEGIAAFHLPVATRMTATPPAADLPVIFQPTADGGSLAVYVVEQSLREKIGRMDMVLRYVVSGPQGTRESLERLTLYSGEPDPFALAAGLVPANPAIDIGGSGFIHTYRRA